MQAKNGMTLEGIVLKERSQTPESPDRCFSLYVILEKAKLWTDIRSVVARNEEREKHGQQGNKGTRELEAGWR